MRRLTELICGCLAFSVALEARELRCFLADNHAETFGWITRIADLDEPHTLVLIDAHSDASAAERSDEIREKLRRVSSVGERAARIAKWRGNGRIQAFNWIEPLMPRPLSNVRWCPAEMVSDPRRKTMTRDAVESLDGRLEFEPRSAGSFSARWETVGASQPGNRISGDVILAVDLDFFAGMAAEKRAEIFQRMWTSAMEWPGLRGVAFAVSRPWLTDDAEADALVRMAVDAVERTRGATLEISGAPDQSPDASLRAAEFSDAGEKPPRWDIGKSSADLLATLNLLEDRLVIRGREIVLPAPLEISADGGRMECDGVWRFPLAAAPVLRVTLPDGASGRTRWFALVPAHPAIDLLPHTGLGKSFSNQPARFVHEVRKFLDETTDAALAPDRWKPPSGGRVRICAEVETAHGWLPAAPIEIRLSIAENFRGTLSECFGMPYVFGIGAVDEANLTGPETGRGSDCANFLIHAWRRQGIALPWGDPGALRARLETVAENLRVDSNFPIRQEWIDGGLAIDFGSHVAAVWEDRAPVGKLGGNDLVAHHLGGFPEIVTLAKLAEKRPPFALRKPRPAATRIIRIAGDVVLAGNDLCFVDGFAKQEADWFVANLEGIPASNDPPRKPRYDFRFPAERIGMLRGAKVDAVSLANNHAGDAGAVGLLEGLALLEKAGIGVFGAGKNSTAACTPWISERTGTRVACFGVSIVDSLAATTGSPGVAKLPEHANLLDAAMAAARSRGERIVVLLHGGDEYRKTVNRDQLRWSRWLARRGASIIAGAHPHVLQPSEIHAGTRVAHSLGNAVYPQALKGADSGEIRSFPLSR
ncbi:MAG: CapA family protein [Verrucomicrobiota bacterium]